MSSPNKPYGPKTPLPPPSGKTSRETLYPKNYIPSIEDHFKKGSIMTLGIITSSIVVKKVKKDMAPDLTTKNIIPLFSVVVLSCYIVDYLQRYGYIPYSI